MARQPGARSGRVLAVLLAVLGGPCVHVAAAAAADDAVDCASINMGRLDVALATDTSTVRTVAMNEGDTLAFTFRADMRATGTITVVAGDGRERRLLYGPHATQVSYTAEKSGAVRFRLATRGGRIAAFVTACSPASGSGAAAPEGFTVDMSVPLTVTAAAPKGGAAPGVPDANLSTLQWLGGAQPGADSPADTYGVNLKVQPAVKVGVLAQFDQVSNPLLGPSALSQQHWLAGPVMSVLLGSGFSLDAHAAWGPADPILGQQVNRQTFDARLTGKQESGPWRFSPIISYAEAKGTIAEVPGPQSVASGSIEVRPEMAYRIDLGSMYIEPKLMVGTVWNLGEAAGTGTATGGQHDPRAMAETGITFGATDGAQLQIGGGVQEGETRAETVWTGKVQLSIPLK